MTPGYRINKTKLSALMRSVELTERNLDRDLAIAVNATSTKTVSLISKEIRTELNAKDKQVKKSIRKGKRATAVFPNTSVKLEETARLPLKTFSARQTKKGVSYKISKKGKRSKIPGAFVVDKFDGHVFIRKGKPRLPLRKPMGPSPWGVFVKKSMSDDVQKQAEAELLHQIERQTRANLLRASGVIKKPKSGDRFAGGLSGK